jgi:hypothetical protein
MTTPAILAAEFTAGSTARGPVLAINQIVNGRRHNVETVNVADKRQARRIATARGLTPWNF